MPGRDYSDLFAKDMPETIRDGLKALLHESGSKLHRETVRRIYRAAQEGDVNLMRANIQMVQFIEGNVANKVEHEHTIVERVKVIELPPREDCMPKLLEGDASASRAG